ncbi:hypothetical protein Vadar_025092 [Vaccinium darrowii]|uniref:Uncharacterized protein n=1 Tax=Vaccinium darrowii TaxID=229202 RepID=A0ACB7YRM4_9ERIC|nr:hypothetical protein Vadar_025092 [Vaccinium darrowii]
MEKEASSLQTTTSPLPNPTRWEYHCNFCDGTFDSGRALGGHQNAHRFEPRESKRTHHVRVPKQDRPPIVPHTSLCPPPLPNFMRPPSLTNCPYCQSHPTALQGDLPPRVANHRQYEWDMMVARAGQGMQPVGSRIGSDLHVMSANGHVEEVDLELKL